MREYKFFGSYSNYAISVVRNEIYFFAAIMPIIISDEKTLIN